MFPVIDAGARHTAILLDPDRRFLYALDSRSNDVTVIDAGTGAVLDYIPVGAAFEMALAPGGRFVVAISRRQFTAIDTASNRRVFQHHLRAGTFTGIVADALRARLLAQTSTGFLVFDADRGRLLRTVDVGASFVVPPPVP